ncbi:MAG: hypothetical protein JSS54_03075, partial [Proteobacteria bacterium]|nr:hypothetical protein [Pseudomonadota bacterium]
MLRLRAQVDFAHRGTTSRRALAGSLSLLLFIQPALAGSGAPNTPPPAPSAYVTNTGTLSTVGSGGCAQQYNPAIAAYVDNQLIAQASQLASDISGTAAKITAFTANQVASDAKAAAAAAKAGAEADMAAGLAEAAVGVATPLDAGPAAPGLAAAGVGAGVASAADSATATAETASSVAYGAQIA